MTKDQFLFFLRKLDSGRATQLDHALNATEAAFLYDELNGLEGGIADANRPAELESWKDWAAEELIEYARTGTIPKSRQKAS
jgi:hypothetical protein